MLLILLVFFSFSNNNSRLSLKLFSQFFRNFAHKFFPPLYYFWIIIRAVIQNKNITHNSLYSHLYFSAIF